MRLLYTLALAAILACGVYADDTRESQAIIKILTVDDTTWAGSSGTVTTDEFFLGKSEFFSAEVAVTTTGTTTYDMILQYKKNDGSWVDDPDGDQVTAETDDWDVHTLAIDYFARAFRLKLTNDDTSYADVDVFLHRDSARRLK